MRRTLGLVAGSLLLAGCTTTVLETRLPSPASQLWGNRTLVVADVAEPWRAATEDAIVRRLPGAVAAHTLRVNSDAADVRSSLFTDAGEDPEYVWDTLVVVSVAATGKTSLGPTTRFAPDTSGWYVHVDLDVSVLRTADWREIYGVKVRSEVGAAGVEDAEQLAPDAAARAASELIRMRIFD